MIADDYPLARDPAGPFDVEVRIYDSEGQQYAFRAPWRQLPTLKDADVYIIRGQNLTSEKIALSLPMD